MFPLEVFFGNVDYVLVAGALLELQVQLNHAAIAGVGYESLDVTISTGRCCYRASVFVDVRILLEVIDRDSVDVDCGLGVSAVATSGRVASLAVVKTIVVTIATVLGVLGSWKGRGDGGSGAAC